MKARKILAVIMCVGMICGSNAYAVGETEYKDLPSVGEIGPEFIHSEDYEVKQASEELLAVSSLNELAEISRENFENSHEASTENTEATRQLLEQYYNEVGEIESLAATLSQAEFFAYLLLADGLDAIEVAVASSDADAAKSEAQDMYPNDASGLQDSYRHFTWNHRLTKDLSKEKARVVACDYEWSAVLLSYAQSAYEDYLNQGYESSTAAAKGYNYAYFMREDAYSVCAAGVEYFNAIFADAAVRDFWNNCHGRAYAADYSYSRSVAFNVANNAGELINSDYAVTDSHIQKVWAWDWYTV